MVNEILEHIHHVRGDVVEGDGRITTTCSSIGLPEIDSSVKTKSSYILTPHNAMASIDK